MNIGRQRFCPAHDSLFFLLIFFSSQIILIEKHAKRTSATTAISCRCKTVAFGASYRLRLNSLNRMQILHTDWDLVLLSSVGKEKKLCANHIHKIEYNIHRELPTQKQIHIKNNAAVYISGCLPFNSQRIVMQKACLCSFNAISVLFDIFVLQWVLYVYINLYIFFSV